MDPNRFSISQIYIYQVKRKFGQFLKLLPFVNLSIFNKVSQADLQKVDS